MPIYEYQCSACRHQLEILQKINDAPLSECPECNETALQKMISATSFQLKGSGWYQSDFKGGAKKPAETDKPASGAESETKAPSNIEAVAETKESKSKETKPVESKPKAAATDAA
ncbi:MAG: zinc ribbon domain-containing protein [Gammaproteobacteria bacterium]|nr:zinc ribbon domain-containing protein [Gammaproteobacteria bacterium]